MQYATKLLSCSPSVKCLRRFSFHYHDTFAALINNRYIRDPEIPYYAAFNWWLVFNIIAVKVRVRSGAKLGS